MGLSQAKQEETDYALSMLSFDIEETDSNIECALLHLQVGSSVTGMYTKVNCPSPKWSLSH